MSRIRILLSSLARRYDLVLLIATLALFSCSSTEEVPEIITPPQPVPPTRVDTTATVVSRDIKIVGTIERLNPHWEEWRTRSIVYKDEDVTWDDDDKIVLFGANGKGAVCNSMDSGFDTDFEPLDSVAYPASYAVFPYQEGEKAPLLEGQHLTMTLPDTIYASGSTCSVPMCAPAAEIAEDDTLRLSFKFLTAILKVSMHDIDDDVTTMEITTHRQISGKFETTLDVSDEECKLLPASETPAVRDKKITVVFDHTKSHKIYYLPFPAQDYDFIQVVLKAGDVVRQKEEWTAVSFERGKMYSASTLYEVQYDDNILAEFGFRRASNKGKVIRDVYATINHHDITITTPYISNPKDLVASFIFNGKSLTVNGVEQISGETVNDFSKPVEYKLTTHDQKEVTYRVTVKASGLPVMEFYTKSDVTSKYEWVSGKTILWNADGSQDYYGQLTMKTRGNTTQYYPKRPYAIKLEQKGKLLGMPGSKRWVLLANYIDRTLIRNDVAFAVARCTDLEWTPRGQFVEVVMNGKHVGNYYLCEKIKVAKKRVNIANPPGTSGDELTGGYLMEVDDYYDRDYKFKSETKGLPYMFSDPDEVTKEQKEYMRKYVNDMERALYNDTRFSKREYLEYMDIDSYIDYWFVNELVRNREVKYPKSVYMYKDRLGKMKAGPVWDFDWGTFPFEKEPGYVIKSYLYYDRLFQDRYFVDRVKERWARYKSKFEAIPDYIRETAARVSPSDQLDHAMWYPLVWWAPDNANADRDLDFDEAIDKMIDSYKKQLKWLDGQISKM